jgi:UDP-N-acetylglucosamine 2-epimerase
MNSLSRRHPACSCCWVQLNFGRLPNDTVHVSGSVAEDILSWTTEALLETTKKVWLEINAGETEYMLMSRHQNAGQSRNTETAMRSFADFAHFTYLGTTFTN